MLKIVRRDALRFPAYGAKSFAGKYRSQAGAWERYFFYKGRLERRKVQKIISLQLQAIIHSFFTLLKIV